MMELALSEAKARLSELVSAARKGERVVITQDGEPDVELVRYRKRGGIDFDRLEAARRRFGIEDASPEEAEAMITALDDPAFSRRVLGFDDDQAG